jgi:SagB-type dehydrogenase family enzyme
MKIDLEQPHSIGSKSLEECISKRESVRSFSTKKIEVQKISQILWAAQGKRGSKRMVPSAGATYPLEIFVMLKGRGFFHYIIKDHSLKQISDSDLRKELANYSWNQAFIHEAGAVIIICADFSRTSTRYGERGSRYVYMEVGHCAQNIHLQAVALDLSSVPVGAFQDEQIKNLLELPENLEPIYIIPIAYQK